MQIKLLEVKIDIIGINDAIKMVERWIWNPGPDGSFHRGSRTNGIRRDKHYIVTPNLEFILAAQKDPEFKKILNKADLAIPDSSSLGFSYWLLGKKRLIRLFLWPLFFLPIKQLIPFDRVSGTDLMEALCKVAAEKGFVTGFLGGKDEVAKKAAECLKKKYPNLKISFAGPGGEVDENGVLYGREVSKVGKVSKVSKVNKNTFDTSDTSTSFDIFIQPLDILFVAFGHIKQEKWIANNLKKIPVHVAIGVGGAFDYLSGSVPRAPKWVQDLGFEWLFRLITQPWRIKRQLALLQYLWLLIKE